MKTITILGDQGQGGTYLLRMQVQRELMVRFGRFQGGRPILVPQGDVVYVGSAMAHQGSMTLARRLLRHATRRNRENPQQIREAMLEVFRDVGLGTIPLRPPSKKTLFWNIDYLLEEKDVELSQVVLMRSGIRLEDELALFLEMEPGSTAVAKGLGAHDRRGHTHVFIVRETADWWRRLPVRLEKYLPLRN
jgi:Uri superfamily endonuclease